jgi:glycine/D-amino acid oxidase-like deaminating enzyme
MNHSSSFSFWQQDLWTPRYDVAIVGGGIIGLSAAISIKERSPERSVVVLERSPVLNGASVRNAGFACFGSLTEILHDMELNGEEATVRLVEQRVRGLQLLRTRLGDAACDYQQHGGSELLFEEHLPALEHIDRVNACLREVFDNNVEVFTVRNDLLNTFGFNSDRTKALVFTPFEGQLHPGRMMRSLAKRAEQCGVVMMMGAEVAELHENNRAVQLSVKQWNEYRTLSAATVVLCTNAFTIPLAQSLTQEFPTLSGKTFPSIKPARAQVLISAPVPSLPFRGVFHLDEGFYYFRNVSSPDGERVLLGGGRNLAPDIEETTDLALNPRIQAALEGMLRNVIAPTLDLTVEHRWSGIMGFLETKLPLVEHLTERVIVGFGCNGMGVALGSTIGEQVADLAERQ